MLAPPEILDAKRCHPFIPGWLGVGKWRVPTLARNPITPYFRVPTIRDKAEVNTNTHSRALWEGGARISTYPAKAIPWLSRAYIFIGKNSNKHKINWSNGFIKASEAFGREHKAKKQQTAERMRHHPSACRLANLLIRSHLGNFCQVQYADLLFELSEHAQCLQEGRDGGLSCIFMMKKAAAGCLQGFSRERTSNAQRASADSRYALLRLSILINCQYLMHALQVYGSVCYMHLLWLLTFEKLLNTVSPYASLYCWLCRLAFHFWHECAEFEHLKEASLKEKRQQADKIVRTSLQILLQHSYVLSYLVYPAITKTNKAPVAYHIYTVDVAAIIRCVRYRPSPYLYHLSAIISWGRDKLSNSM